MGVLTSNSMDKGPYSHGSMPTRSTPKQASECPSQHASNDADTCCRMTTMHDMRLEVLDDIEALRAPQVEQSSMLSVCTLATTQEQLNFGCFAVLIIYTVSQHHV
jgi:hypothetical protein